MNPPCHRHGPTIVPAPLDRRTGDPAAPSGGSAGTDRSGQHAAPSGIVHAASVGSWRWFLHRPRFERVHAMGKGNNAQRKDKKNMKPKQDAKKPAVKK